MTPTIAVCLQTCDRRAYTERTLDTFAIQNAGRQRWLLLHGDDASREPGIPELAQAHGFETVVHHQTRQGARVTRQALFTAASDRGADWILLLENDWEWVRPFPWTAFEYLVQERPDVYSLRLYGEYKARGQQAKCSTRHLGHPQRPAVAWWSPPAAPDQLQIGKIHWGAPPAITRTRELLQIASWVKGNREPGDAAEVRVSGRLDAYVARVPDNVVYHIGERTTRAVAGARPSTTTSRPARYTEAWQRARAWTEPNSTACLLTVLASCKPPITSFLDVGCGSGHLVTLGRRKNIDAVGVDLSVAPGSTGPLRHADLRQPFTLGHAFPLVLCWEVAEHLPAESADILCDSLVAHLQPGGLLLFTAATPGQGGDGHLNEQPSSYWRAKLEARGLRYESDRTSTLARQWLSVAPRTPWYGRNLQSFRRPSSVGVQEAPVTRELPRLAITMRTADRSPNPNYLGGTVRRLLAQDLQDGALHLCVTDPNVAWLESELGALQARITVHVPETRRTPNENGLAQVRCLESDAYDWVLLLEDDLVFCADFVDSVRRWIADHATPARHFYRLFGFRVTPPGGKKVAAYDASLLRCAGSQAVLLRMADAQDFVAWADANLASWGGFRGNARIAFDKLLAAWVAARWGNEPGVMSHPMFVKHGGRVSSLHPKTAHMDSSFAGESWSYRGAVPRASVPRLWPGETIICIGGGTVTQEDVDAVRGRARVIAINDAYRLAPWADVLYAADAAWWKEHDGVPTFAGLKYAIDPYEKSIAFPSDVTVLRNTGETGLERNPSGLRTGKNSGFQAVNLAAHLGARRIVLLGYDMQRLTNGRAHWFGEHPSPLFNTAVGSYPEWCKLFATLVEPLHALGIEIVNASTHTALTCFPRVSLDEALHVEAVA